MIGGRDLRESVLKIFDETFAVTTVLLLIALAVAALGITTTLSVLVLERTRQLNTMAAVGASFGQIRAMIFWEAGFLVVAGEVAGLACGFILSYLLVYVINRQSFGWTFLYTVDWGDAGAFVAPDRRHRPGGGRAGRAHGISGTAGDAAEGTLMNSPKPDFAVHLASQSCGVGSTPRSSWLARLELGLWAKPSVR